MSLVPSYSSWHKSFHLSVGCRFVKKKSHKKPFSIGDVFSKVKIKVIPAIMVLYMPIMIIVRLAIIPWAWFVSAPGRKMSKKERECLELVKRLVNSDGFDSEPFRALKGFLDALNYLLSMTKDLATCANLVTTLGFLGMSVDYRNVVLRFAANQLYEFSTKVNHICMNRQVQKALEVIDGMGILGRDSLNELQPLFKDFNGEMRSHQDFLRRIRMNAAAHRESDTEKFHDAVTEIDPEKMLEIMKLVLTFSGTAAGIMTAAFKQSLDSID